MGEGGQREKRLFPGEQEGACVGMEAEMGGVT